MNESITVEIGRISLQINGGECLNTLNPLEQHLLSQFVRARRIAGPSFIANFHIMDAGSSDQVKSKGLPVKEIQAFYPYKDDPRIQRLLSFNEKNASAGFCDEQLRAFNSAIKNEDAEIMLGYYNNKLLIYNKKTFECDIFLRKLKVNTPWMRNLHALRMVYRMILNTGGNGTLFHASSVELDSNGYVFIGHSGAGKSTTAGLLNPVRILSDDMSLIRRNKGNYELFPNPWWNPGVHIINSPQRPASLKALFFIKKSGRTAIRKMNYKEALATLIYGDHAFQQTGFLDNKAGISSFFLFVQQLLKDVPVFELSVKKDKGFKEEFVALLDKVHSTVKETKEDDR